MSAVRTGAVGASIERRDARPKATGEAKYAYEHQVEGVAYAALVQSRMPRGRIVHVHGSRALELQGVLAVISHENAPRLNETELGELFIFQQPQVAYYGQIVAAVVAETLETAREAAALVEVEIEPAEHDVTLRVDHPGLYKPKHVAHRTPETRHGDVDAALAAAAVRLDRVYTTPAEHNMPMEPHSSLALWDSGSLTVYESTQYPHGFRGALAALFGLELDQVRVISPNVGGGFGSKGSPRPQVVVAAMAAQMIGRPVKISLTRREMFPISGHRPPTIQHIRVGANTDGTMTAWEHVSYSQTSQLNEFCEPCTTGARTMYAAPDRFNTHWVVRLDVPSPGFCRAPGEAPGFFALESALDELAQQVGVDPVELRIRNEPDRDPDTGEEFSSRNLVACLQEGADRFGWWDRVPVREGQLLVGHGVASSMHPTWQAPSTARVSVLPDGPYVVSIAAADVG
ncbi:MAG TPA: molybdopterin cofactor-binding domain-containing protein, partial [Gaiellaceae bacterium]